MKFKTLILLFLLTLPAWAGEKAALSSEHSAFLGRAKKQQYLEDLEMSGCSAERICMDVYYRWTIEINQHVSGPILPRIVKAAMLQHSEYIYAGKQVALYVLAKIVDPEKRKLLGADYYIEEYAPPHEVYCVKDNKADYGLERADAVSPSAGPACYARHAP